MKNIEETKVQLKQSKDEEKLLPTKVYLIHTKIISEN
jgi:hypothetical protein